MLENRFEALGLGEGYRGLRRALYLLLVLSGAISIFFQSAFAVGFVVAALIHTLNWAPLEFTGLETLLLLIPTVLVFCLPFRPVLGPIMIVMGSLTWGITGGILLVIHVESSYDLATSTFALKWAVGIVAAIVLTLVVAGVQCMFIYDEREF